jgi:hypothetical protein
MLKINLVIVNFFTEKKKVMNFFSSKDNLEKVLDRIGEAFPEAVLVAYHKGKEVLAHRPKMMMKEKEEVLSGKMDAFDFTIRWRVIFGEQIMPDLSLPTRKIKKVKEKKEEIFEGDLTPSRAEFVELIPCGAGI